MRSKYRMGWAALVAAVAIVALSAGTAFATTPEFSENVKPGEKFTGHVSSPIWEYSNPDTWTDSEATISGEIVTSGTHAFRELQNVSLTFKGGDSLMSCDNGAPGAYETVLTGLIAYLGYLNESTKLIGLAIFKPGGESFQKLERILTPCVSNWFGNDYLEGAFAVPLTNAKVNSKIHGLNFKIVPHGKMEYSLSTFRWNGGSPFGGLSFKPELTRQSDKSLLQEVGIGMEMPFETANSIYVTG